MIYRYFQFLSLCLYTGTLLQNRFVGCTSNLISVGCYEKKDISGFKILNSELFSIKKSASTCVASCRNIYKRFAGIINGTDCMCGEYISGFDAEECTIKCVGNPDETCGGASFISIYETAGGALGAPQSLSCVKSTEDSIQIIWKPPAHDLSKINEYSVKATPLFFFNEQYHPSEKEYKYSYLTQTAIVDGLSPGTKYNITIAAVSDIGEGYRSHLEVWTKVGTPDKPRAPVVLSHTLATMIIKLEPIIPSGGPVSSYQIIVVDETLPVVINFTSLLDITNSIQNGLPYYITAEINPDEFETVFTVGDNKQYGRFLNVALQTSKDYHILLGVISTINETKSAYSESVHSHHQNDYHSHKTLHNSNDFYLSDKNDVSEVTTNFLDGKIVLGLSIAVGLFAFLLIAFILVYLSLRVYFKRNTRLMVDHQELAVHAQIPNQDYENGYTVGTQYLEENASPDYYRNLREKVKIFPHQSINIVADIGVGKFGDVKKGIFVNQGIEHVNALIHRIQDDSLKPIYKSEMLKDFETHIRINNHQHVVSLLGLLEELNTVSFIFEYETLSLKSNLIESRAVQHYPVYAEKNRRFSTLQEQQVLHILVGIAKGMVHLYSLNIAHGQLCARNIALENGIHPKITGFGLIHHHNDVYIPDYRRWKSIESAHHKVSTSTGDVWSFGCLMWEVITLGGTPYVDVGTDELVVRITRGLRLSQPQYLSDDLYQSMLLCWQNDPDERPSFVELEALLQRLANDDITPHLLFSLYPSFKYELYSSPLEFLD